MFYINPKDFEGCKSKSRINLDTNISYMPIRHVSKKYGICFTNRTHSEVKFTWQFNSEENRDKALDEIDLATNTYIGE